MNVSFLRHGNPFKFKEVAKQAQKSRQFCDSLLQPESHFAATSSGKHARSLEWQAMALFLPLPRHATTSTATQWHHSEHNPSSKRAKMNLTTAARLERFRQSDLATDLPERALLRAPRTKSPFVTIPRTVAGDPAKIMVLGDGVAGIAASEQIKRLRPSHRARGPIACRDVRAIDTDHHRLVLTSGESMAYDRLILADSRVDQPSIKDSPKVAGRFILNKATDERYVSALLGDALRLNHARSAIVVGADRAGLEIALWLRKRHLKVSVLEGSELLLEHTLDRRGSGLVQRHLENFGIRIMTAVQMHGLGRAEPSQGETVQLSDGRVLHADMVMATPHPDPCLALAKAAGIASRHGILVDDFMQTSERDIYAAGDIAEHDGMTACDEPSALEQGQIAGRNVLGERSRYRGRVAEQSLCLGGLDILSIGQIDTRCDGVYSITHEQTETLKYRKLVFAAGLLLGAILIGYPDEVERISSLVKQRADLTPVMPALHRGRWGDLAQLAVAA